MAPFIARSMDNLLSEIELFMSAHGMSHWQFGQQAIGDKHFVRQLRDGRDIRMSTVAKVRKFMLGYQHQDAA